MLRSHLTTTAILAALFAASLPATAQEAADSRSTIRGLSLGIHGSTAALTRLEDRSTALGGGLALAVGYGFGDRFALHATTSGAFMSPPESDDYLLSHVDLEGRHTLGGRNGAWAPHLALGAGVRTARYDVPASQGGGTTTRATLGLTAGGGLSYYLSPAASLDWSLRYTFGNLKEPRCPDPAEAVRPCATSTRMNVGISWYPRAR